MNLRGLRSQLARIEKAKPKPLGTLDWAVWCGLKPIPDMNAEIATGFGITYAGLAELPPPPDPLEMALARLNAEHPDKPPPSPPAVLPVPVPPAPVPAPAPVPPA